MEYCIEYQDIVIFNPGVPLGIERLKVDAGSFEEAALKAIGPLTHNSDHMDVYNATIVGPDGKRYEILRKGSWLINLKTGERISNLEKKVSQIH